MKFFLVVSVVLASAAAATVSDYAPILKSSYDITPEGAFQYAYETGNGIYAEAAGVLKNVNGENPAIAIQGGFKYTAPGGEPVAVTYEADELGFRPSGSHLPVPPPIPEAIVRSLAYIASHPPSQYEKAPLTPNRVYSALG